ncbi:MAG: proton-conducting transporter membrane subunit, partial [Opitutales bacterium]
MDSLISAILLVPMISAGTILLFFRRDGETAAKLSVGAAALSLILALAVIFRETEPSLEQVLWLKLGNLELKLGYLFDGEAKLLLFVVTFVGFLIHVFSLGYMRKDPGKARFFGGMSIFMFAMLGIVVSDNLAMLFVFWELVGFSSYLLIAHYFNTGEATAASQKAFIINRLGDMGFLLGIALTQAKFGTLEFVELEKAASLQ